MRDADGARWAGANLASNFGTSVRGEIQTETTRGRPTTVG
jgi:hypothetical protein